jgi:prepilin-type N-terminal cleavage/methylation domain-containing protein
MDSTKNRRGGEAIAQGVPVMKSKFGFTLVELLVVIAIISILAAIVVPKVQGGILKARQTKCEAEIRSIETQITKLLTDANKSSLKHLFRGNTAGYTTLFGPPVSYAQVKAQVEGQTDLFYELLRQGRNANVTNYGVEFAEGVREKMGTSYLPDLNLDGWDQLYQMYAGPWEASSEATEAEQAIPFRSWRTNLDANLDRSDPLYVPYEYDAAAKTVEDNRIPGNPDLELTSGNAGFYQTENGFPPGYPAPVDSTIYIFSRGVNLRPDQNYVINDSNPALRPPNSHKGGGDDINSWDKTRGWSGFYAG